MWKKEKKNTKTIIIITNWDNKHTYDKNNNFNKVIRIKLYPRKKLLSFGLNNRGLLKKL